MLGSSRKLLAHPWPLARDKCAPSWLIHGTREQLFCKALRIMLPSRTSIFGFQYFCNEMLTGAARSFSKDPKAERLGSPGTSSPGVRFALCSQVQISLPCGLIKESQGSDHMFSLLSLASEGMLCAHSE